MSSDEDQFGIANPVKFGMRIVLLDCMLHGVNNAVTGDVDGVGVLTFLDQMILCQLCGREVVLRHDAQSLTIELFRVRRVDVVGTKTSFDVTNQDLQVEASKCGYKRRRGIAMHQNHIRILGFKHFPNTVEDVRSNVKQSLTVLHDVEIIVRDYIENSQNLVEHLTMLRRNANNSLDTLACLELIYEWAHFYCFWPCAKDKHNCFHLITSYI